MRHGWKAAAGSVIVSRLFSPSHISRIGLRLVPAVFLLSIGSPLFAQRSIGELYATDASVKGSVLLAGSGTSVLSGSQIAAGAQAATLKLERGGDVLVCPGTSLSVSASENGRQLLLSINSGNLELNYPIGSATDSLMTPDFRLLLPGPGKIHVAMRVNANGDTCVQSLPENSSALLVAEAMGDESYEVKQDEAVMFKAGHIQGAVRSHQSCGCPAPAPVQVARAVPPPEPAVPKKLPPTSGAALAAAMDESAPEMPESHLSVEAPFVFTGEGIPPDMTAVVAHLKVDNHPVIAMQPQVLPPGKQKKTEAKQQQTVAANQPTEKRSVFSKIGAFFASIFR
jgi:hypothetical protein